MKMIKCDQTYLKNQTLEYYRIAIIKYVPIAKDYFSFRASTDFLLG